LGGLVDFTASITDGRKEENDLSAARAFARFLGEGIPAANMTFTSDGQGSLPVFDCSGRLAGLGVGTCSSLLCALKEAVFVLGLPLGTALLPLTSSPAAILKLVGKGRIEAGADADFVVLDTALDPLLVIARGKILVKSGVSVVAGTFEKLG
jgi:beta-aspartyl-dipeptidase (metallo-type)